MAIITQKTFFNWKDLEEQSDLDILRLVLENLPDEKLMRRLEKKRSSGRNDYPIRAIWNSVIAGIVFGHDSIESLIRELRRNPVLRETCGFEVLSKTPKSWIYTRFLKKLLKRENRELIERMFDDLVEEVSNLIPDFGESQGIDSKEIPSFAKRENKNKKEDGRRDLEADYAKKVYKGKDKDGRSWEVVKKWFGYKIHLLVDTKYELPINYKVTKASISDTKELLPLIEETKVKHSEIIERAKECSADKGYDSEENIKGLLEYGINPIIDIREMWKDGDKTKTVYDDVKENIVYDAKGRVYCCLTAEEKMEMAFCGYEKNRGTLKYRCPAKAYSFKCRYAEECARSNSEYGKVVRIKLETDPRIFTPIARSSYKWGASYKKRTAVERVNSRLDISYGFENHKIRGKKKIELKTILSLSIMLAINEIRSLFGSYQKAG